jgi:thiol peroxidase
LATFTLQGNETHTNGDLPAIGSDAPDFHLVTTRMQDVRLADYQGKKKLLDIVASLDTGICVTSAKKFGEALKGRDDVVALVVSADLPFAQQRACTAEGVENVELLSMMRTRAFAKDYGVLITDGPLAGLAARSVVIIDENDKVTYTQLVPELSTEPDYEAAIAAL